MQNWFLFFNSIELDESPFLKAALLHYTFENIHPFCDGNGRMGRALMRYYLMRRGITSVEHVPFSMMIESKLNGYYFSLQSAENELADCTPFIEYMLEAMVDAYEVAAGRMERPYEPAFTTIT